MSARVVAAGFTIIMAILILLIVGTWANVALAEPTLCRTDVTTKDLCEFRASSLGHEAEFFFYNDGGKTSVETVPFHHERPPAVYSFKDITITVRMKVTSDYETIYIETDRHFASPPEADVRDGESVVIQIIESIM